MLFSDNTLGGNPFIAIREVAMEAASFAEVSAWIKRPIGHFQFLQNEFL